MEYPAIYFGSSLFRWAPIIGTGGMGTGIHQ